MLPRDGEEMDKGPNKIKECNPESAEGYLYSRVERSRVEVTYCALCGKL